MSFRKSEPILKKCVVCYRHDSNVESILSNNHLVNLCPKCRRYF